MLNKKFYLYALISSPLLALQGVGPFYSFQILNLEQSVQLYISVLISAILYWLINGYIFLVKKKKRTWRMILLSYFLTFFSNIIKGPFRPIVDFNSALQDYLIYPIVATIALNTIILIIINLIIEEQEKLEAKSIIADLNIKKLEAENQVLLQQLQPHFLFNTLSVLKSLIKEDPDLAEAYSIKLSEFLRYAVESHNTEMVSLENEMKFVNNYIDLQKIRFDNAFTFESKIPEEIMHLEVPVFAIQTLVENAFKHNYFTEKRPLKIVIDYEAEKLQVWNNIVSLKLTERAGTGLANLKKRVEFLTKSSIEVQETETHFSVKIPVIEA